MPLPIVLSLLAADRVTRHRDTGRFDLYGVFHALALPLPNRITFAVYYGLRAVDEPFDLGISFDSPSDDPLGGGTVRVAISDPMAIVQSSAQFDVAITTAGTHWLRLKYRGALLAERPILIHPPSGKT